MSKVTPQPKIGFVSLGCPKNLVDSERILTELRTEGYDVVPSYDDADVITSYSMHYTKLYEQTWLQPLELPAGLGSVQLTAGGDIRPPRADEAVSVRFKAPGLLHIVGRNGGRKLKKIWQELGVPPWLRDTTPLLFYGETLIAAAGVFVTQEGVAEGEKGVSFVWQKTLS